MPFQGPTPGAEGSMVNANGQFDMNAMMMMGMVRKNDILLKMNHISEAYISWDTQSLSNSGLEAIGSCISISNY